MQQDPDLVRTIPSGTDIMEEIDIHSHRSTTSSVTMESTNSVAAKSTKKTVVARNSKSDDSMSSIKTMNTMFFERLFEEHGDLTNEEKEKMAAEKIKHAMTKYALKAQRNCALLLSREEGKKEKKKNENTQNETNTNDQAVPNIGKHKPSDSKNE